MIFLTIAILLAVFFGVGFYQASKLRHIQIKKTVHIEGTEQAVFEKVMYLKNFPEWSPFLEADPTQKIEVKGIDGQIGAQYHWLGNKGKDVGYQEIKAITPFTYIKMECDIQKPFEARPVFEYTFVKTNDGIEVTQNFELTSGGVDSFFMWLFGAKRDMSKMNARGMELLKIAIEK